MKVTLLAGLWNTSQGQCHLVSGDDVQSMLGDFQLRSAQDDTGHYVLNYKPAGTSGSPTEITTQLPEDRPLHRGDTRPKNQVSAVLLHHPSHTPGLGGFDLTCRHEASALYSK
ncbi:uncharacterized [Tachysurus ichikawai]